MPAPIRWVFSVHHVAVKRQIRPIGYSLHQPAASEQLPTRQRKERQKPRGVGKLHGEEIGKFLTEEQRNQLAKHEREVAKLIEVLPSASDAVDAVQKKILDENRAIRKLRIKARRAKRKQQELNLSP